jgi:hypothetical protein
MAKDSAESPPKSRPHHLSPAAVISLQAYRAALDRGDDDRSAAHAAGLPRSTLRDLNHVPHGETASRDALVRSNEGWEFVRKVVDAALFVFHVSGGVGLPTFRRFLELSGLNAFVASSYGAMHERANAMTQKVIALGDSERARLGNEMTVPKEIIIGLDETFFPPRTCLVCADMLSGILLFETFASSRDRAAWLGAWQKGTKGLSLQVSQAVADGAKGIRAFVEGDLNAHRGPDLFHVLNDIGKAFAVHHARQERAAQGRKEGVLKMYVDLREFAERRESESRRGRPIDFKAKGYEARGLIASVSKEVLIAERRREEFRTLLNALSDAYLPVGIFDAKRKSAADLHAELEAIFATLDALAEKSGLGAHHLPYLEKADRCVQSMVDTLEFFNAHVNRVIAEAGLDARHARALETYLLPAALLRTRARLASSNDERKRLRSLAHNQRIEALQELGLALLNTEFLALEALSEKISLAWQRSTSSIEGRNGYLSQKYHDLRGMSETKLACLTHLHNFYARRSDGTTAAVRFFGSSHLDIARETIASMGDLKRPRYSVVRAA